MWATLGRDIAQEINYVKLSWNCDRQFLKCDEHASNICSKANRKISA